MRFLALTLALAALPAIATEYPLWNGEPIEEYAKKVGLPPTKTLDLGGGVTMEFVLIPAADFSMGYPSPESSWMKANLCGFIGFVILVVLSVDVFHRWKRKGRLQFGLLWLVVFVCALACITFCFVTRSILWEDMMVLEKGPGRGANPERVCDIRISRPYYIGRFEVTTTQYLATMTGREGDLPVTNITYAEAQSFCERLGRQTGTTARLPTEAEWEHACRAGARLGDDSVAYLNRVAWYQANSGGQIHGVGLKEPNAWGVFDMHGNVWEYCRGDLDLATLEDRVDPVGLLDGPPVVRGGAFDTYWYYCRCHVKDFVGNPRGSRGNVGLRVVVTVVP